MKCYSYLSNLAVFVLAAFIILILMVIHAIKESELSKLEQF